MKKSPELELVKFGIGVAVLGWVDSCFITELIMEKKPPEDVL
jgi:hypothetical protein